MLNSGKKLKINILTIVLSEKKILNGTKNHNPPCKLKDGPFNLRGGGLCFFSKKIF
jgi:hypothetical protein